MQTPVSAACTATHRSSHSWGTGPGRSTAASAFPLGLDNEIADAPNHKTQDSGAHDGFLEAFRASITSCLPARSEGSGVFRGNGAVVDPMLCSASDTTST
eukprot:7752508-Pyramimonas_sp.AAC.1